MKRAATSFSLLLLALLAFSLRSIAAQETTPDASAPLRVMATTTILADVARNVGGDRVVIDSLLPPDADTHAYEPSVDDATRIANADVMLVVGVGYEGFLSGLLEAVGEDIPVVDVSNGLEVIALGGDDHDEAEADATEEAQEAYQAGEVIGVVGVDAECAAHEETDATEEAGEEDDHGACDPHVWTNPLNVITWANNIADAFAAADPADSAYFRENAADYAAQLEALDLEIQELLSDLPEAQRILVTNHEFLGYFAAHYGFEVVATVLPGVSTGAEPDPQSLAELITLIEAEGVPAIFAEVSANPQIAQLVAQEAGITVVSTLYSESLSDADGVAPTYIAYMRYNARTIADALR